MADLGVRTCLVLTTAAPAATEIREHTDGLLDYVIRPALEPAGYHVVSLDSISAPGTVSDAVLRHLRNDELIVADLSFNDPTVMYALGVRHSFGMSAIHVRTPSSTFPFDIEGLDSVVIELDDVGSVKHARRELATRVERIDAAQSQPSPILATLQLDAMRAARIDDEDLPGPAAMVNGLKAIEQRLTMMERLMSESRRPAAKRSRRVFVVHGHDAELTHQLARVLTELQFDVVILKELADSGRTLLEKLRAEVNDIGFVFVIFTPDDIAAAKRDPDSFADRPRQNVIYEHGLFTGLLDPGRICSIMRGSVELPSDLHGLVTKQIPEGAGIEAIQFELLQELKRAGYDVDANQLMR